MKLELVPVPVTDVDRARRFYVEQVGARSLNIREALGSLASAIPMVIHGCYRRYHPVFNQGLKPPVLVTELSV
jgi:hypothetical protein